MASTSPFHSHDLWNCVHCACVTNFAARPQPGPIHGLQSLCHTRSKVSEPLDKLASQSMQTVLTMCKTSYNDSTYGSANASHKHGQYSKADQSDGDGVDRYGHESSTVEAVLLILALLLWLLSFLRLYSVWKRRLTLESTAIFIEGVDTDSKNGDSSALGNELLLKDPDRRTSMQRSEFRTSSLCHTAYSVNRPSRVGLVGNRRNTVYCEKMIYNPHDVVHRPLMSVPIHNRQIQSKIQRGESVASHRTLCTSPQRLASDSSTVTAKQDMARWARRCKDDGRRFTVCHSKDETVMREQYREVFLRPQTREKCRYTSVKTDIVADPTVDHSSDTGH